MRTLTIREALRITGAYLLPPCRPRRRFWTMRYKPPGHSRWRQKSTRATTKRNAEEYLRERIVVIAAGEPTRILDWEEFSELYQSQYLIQLSAKSREAWDAVCKWLDRISPPATLTDINAAFVRTWRAELGQRGKSEATRITYTARLKAALSWAVEQDYLQTMPDIPNRATKRGGKNARAREVRPNEFAQLLDATRRVRPGDYPVWQRLLRGYWWSDFRLDELRRLSWDNTTLIWLDDSGEYPLVRFEPGAQKNDEAQWHPIIPEFWEVCCEVPVRKGLVFPLPKRQGKGQYAYRTVQKVIAQIGITAGVVTNAATGKTATAHDLRRGFGTRMASILTMPELQKWMRHKAPETTQTYYHHADAEQLAAKVWGSKTP